MIQVHDPKDVWKLMLVKKEGMRLRPYWDTADPPRLTIGVGRNLSDVGITRKEALHLLDNDVSRVETDLDGSLDWWRNLPPGAQEVLVDLCFQLGLGRLLGFKDTLAAIRDKRYLDAASNLLDSRYARQTRKRAERNAEQLRKLA